jgi:riboflavin kinase/FMN adenylyltransferase
VSVLVIGKFEGLHLGHRALINEVTRRAKSLNSKAILAAFRPHPQKILHDPHYAPLFSNEEFAEITAGWGLDEVVFIPFTADFANMPAEDFCRWILQEFAPQEIVVGEGFRFGKESGGTVEMLEKIFNVKIFPLLKNPSRALRALAGRPAASAAPASPDVRAKNFNIGEINTSRIRGLLKSYEFEKASELLGFSFFLMGVVEKGRQMGRVLGFPTLNIYPCGDKFLPQNGVYVTRTIIDGVAFAGLTNIGVRPTVTDEDKLAVETHIPDLVSAPNAMYGKRIKVEFLRFIRAEKKFGSAEELQFQIKSDLVRGDKFYEKSDR